MIEMHSAWHAIDCADAPAARTLVRVLQQLIAHAATAYEWTEELPGQGAFTVALADSPDVQDGDSRENAALSCPELLALSLGDALNSEDSVGTLNDIARELTALLDTGRSDRDLLTALARLDSVALAIGRGHDADAPMAVLQAQLDAVRAEKQKRRETASARTDILESLGRSKDHITELRAAIQDNAARLYGTTVAAAEMLQREIDRLAREIQTVAARPALDSDQAAAIQRAETLVETSRLQLERTRDDLREVDRNLRLTETPEGGQNASRVRAGLPDQLQRDMRSGLGRIAELGARLDEVSTQLAAIDNQICATQNNLATLPDFTRIAPNPVDWLNQLARSFKTALTMQKSEDELLVKLHGEVADLRVEIAGDAAIFEQYGNFAQDLIEHENKRKCWETRGAVITERLQENCNQRDELQEATTGLFALAMGCTMFFSLMLGVFAVSQKTPILYPAGFMLLSSGYFFVRLFAVRRGIAHFTQRIAEDHAEQDVLMEEQKNDVSQVDRLMARAGCGTSRELEARYDRYRELRTRLNALEARYLQQQENVRESDERIPKLFERVRATLEQIDEPPHDEEDVDAAVGRAIAKYQVYRETKRRLSDLRNQHQGLLGRKRFLEKEQQAARERITETERDIRGLMRENGFVEETRYPDISAALTAYYAYLDKTEEIVDRQELLAATRHNIEGRLAQEEQAFEQQREALRLLLAQTGFDSPTLVRQAAQNAALLHDLREERREKMRALDALLQGRTLEDWRALLPANNAAAQTASASDDLAACQECETRLEQQLEAATREHQRALGEWQRLDAALSSAQALDEEEAALEKEQNRLRSDLEAAAHAMAMMEEALDGYRFKLAETLAAHAEKWLAAFQSPARIQYTPNGMLGPELTVSTEEHSAPAHPARVAFALRLALMQTLVPPNADAPLIVDATLQTAPLHLPAETVIEALRECAGNRQLIVVSDNGALLAAAEAHGASLSSV